MAKSPGAFRSISEAAEEAGVPQHTLRAWEERFSFVRPVKRPDGRRYYRPEDVALLREVARRLSQGADAEQIRRLHRDGALRASNLERPPISSSGATLREALDNLRSARDRLERALAS